MIPYTRWFDVSDSQLNLKLRKRIDSVTLFLTVTCVLVFTNTRANVLFFFEQP